MDAATTFVEDSLNGVIWNLVPWFLVAAGVYFGLRTLFVQIRMVPDMFKAVSETPKGKDREGRDLDEEYGGTVGWLEAAGWTPEQVTRLRDRLVG